MWNRWIVLPMLALTCASASLVGCSDDEDSNGNGTGGRSGSGGSGGTSTGGAAGDAGSGGSSGSGTGGAAGSGGTAGAGGSAGAAGAAGAGGSAGAAGSAGAGGVGDRDVFRPEVRPLTEERVAQLQVPEGFAIQVFARDLGHARMLEAAAGGGVYLTRPNQGDVLRLADTNDDGVADVQETVASGIAGVHGIALNNGQLYLATPTEVLRGTVGEDGSVSTPTPIITDLPDGGQHPNRTLRFGTDGALYISVGSSCDACAETNPEHATILRAQPDGSSRAIFARGLRNTIGFDWHPVTNALWGMDNGSDWRGNELPPEELNQIVEGRHYGWPYCYADQQVDPVIMDPVGTTKEAFCATTAPSELENTAHGAPIAMQFYRATAFPESYRGDAFVALRGSWNRFPPSGYKIARVDFDAEGQPVAIEDFVTGFLIEEGQATFARVAGLVVAADGALMFTDDTNGVIYRVTYGG